jgi:hypothetical protein
MTERSAPITGMTWVPDIQTPESGPDPDLRRYVDEGRRQTALELAVKYADQTAMDTDQVLTNAARFEAFIRDGNQSPLHGDILGPGAELIKFLIAVRDCDVRTYAGEVSIYEKQTSATWTVSKEFAEAAQQAGLVLQSDAGSWHLTGRGREAADRGQV